MDFRVNTIIIMLLIVLTSCARKTIETKEKTISLNGEYRLFNDYDFSFYQKNFDSILNNPKILMPSVEYTFTNVNGAQYSAVKGGLGTVVTDLTTVLPEYLKSHFKKYELAFIVPLYEKIKIGKLYKIFSIDMGVRTELVTVYEDFDINGNSFYFISSDAFNKIGRKNIYAPNNFDMIYSFVLFGKTVGKFIEDYEPNIIHFHENTAAYSLLYTPNYISSVLQTHNSGFYYNHIIEISLKSTLSSLGVEDEIYEQYFHQTISNANFFNLQLISQLISHYNLLSVLTVSPGYAQEIKMTATDIKNMIYEEKKLPMMEPFHMDPYNGWVDYEVVDGIYNGLSESRTPQNDPYLKKWEDKEGDDSAITNEVKDLWNIDLNFSFNQDDKESATKLIASKSILKKMLQINFGLDQNKDAPIFSIISRIDLQKNLSVFVNNIDYVVKNGGQVIVAGEGSDSKVIKKLNDLQATYPKQVHFHNHFVQKRLKSLILGGSDFFVMPSAFEPCGLVDIENYWYGNIGILHKTGGLIKNSQSIFYTWQDQTDKKGEVLNAKKAFIKALSIYNEKTKIENESNKIELNSDFRKRQLHGLSMEFKWSKALDEYFDLYRSTAIYKLLMCASNNKCAKQNGDISELYSDIIKAVPKSTLIKFLFLIEQKKGIPPDVQNFINIIKQNIKSN